MRAIVLGAAADAPPELVARLLAMDPFAPGGARLARDRRSTVVAWEVAGQPVAVKSYPRPRWLFWRHPPGVRSTGRREWDALCALQTRGVPAVAPLAAVEWRVAGCAVSSAVATRLQPAAQSAVDVLNARAVAPDPAPDARYRRALAEAAGRLVARCHVQGIRYGRLSLKNVLVTDPSATTPELCLVDAPWARAFGMDAAPPDLRGTAGALADLHRLDGRSWTFFHRAERLRFVRAYLDGGGSAAHRALVTAFYRSLGRRARAYEREPGRKRPRSWWWILPSRVEHRWRARGAPRWRFVRAPAMPQRCTLDLHAAHPGQPVAGRTADTLLAELISACGPHLTALRVWGGDDAWAELLVARARGAGIPDVQRGRFPDHGGPWREVCVAADGSVRCCPATPRANAYGSLIGRGMRVVWRSAAVDRARRGEPPCGATAAAAPVDVRDAR